MGRAGPSQEKKTSNIVGFLVYLVYGLYFLYCGNTNLVLKYPVFTRNVAYIYIYMYIYIYIYIYMSEKKMFSCVLHTTNTLTYFEFPLFLKKKTNI